MHQFSTAAMMNSHKLSGLKAHIDYHWEIGSLEWAEIVVAAGCIHSADTWERSCFLLFQNLKTPHIPWLLESASRLSFSFTCKASCDYIKPTLIIQDNPSQGKLISNLNSPFPRNIRSWEQDVSIFRGSLLCLP